MFSSHNLYSKIISPNNLLAAFYEFRRGKRGKPAVAEFEIDLEENIYSLHRNLKNFTYRHGPYSQFKIFDPKPRIVHKATVSDRIVHQAVYRILYPIFDRQFIFSSYSSRIGKGTHKAVAELAEFVRRVSHNFKKPCFGLKIDIKKFFYSIDHRILIALVQSRVACSETMWLVGKIVGSFETEKSCGLPLGNVTSQLFANIYLNSLDHFIKCGLRQKQYLRFCDDLMIIGPESDFDATLSKIRRFLAEGLRLEIKPSKLGVRKLRWGLDYLGTVVLPHHKVLRTKTRKRVWRNLNHRFRELEIGEITAAEFNQTLQSYLGQIRHINGHKLKSAIEESYGNRITN